MGVYRVKTVQAKHIDDDIILAAMAKVEMEHGKSMRWDIEDALPQFPAKVVVAKLASMVRRKVIDGCTCGCRGDFEVL